MSATEIATDVKYQLKFLDGRTSSGNAKLVSVSLGKLSVARYATNDAFALANLMLPIMDKQIQKEELTRTSQVART